MQHEMPPTWAIIGLCVAGPMVVVFLFRVLTARTNRALAINFALCMAVGLVILVILGIPGLGPSHEEIEQAQRQAPKPDELLRAIPWEFFAAGAIWIIGGNLIHLRQRRKAGESWLQALNPFAPFGRHMDRRSWLQLLLLAVVSLAVAQFGFVRNVPHQADDTATIRPQP